jgi:trans-aconitate 2-methyltransferase
VFFLRKGFLLLVLAYLCSHGCQEPACQKWVAEEYVANGLLQSKWAKNFFFERYAWSGDEHVLDIGCGDGRLTHLLADYVPNGSVRGIDRSSSMINHARQKHDIANLCFELVDATSISFYENFSAHFDLIVAFHSLHWFKEQEKVLQGMKKCLKPGGRAFIRLTSKGWDPIQEMADELIKEEKWTAHFDTFEDPVQRYNVEEYQCLVEEAGLQSVRIEEVFEDDTLSSREVLAKQIKSWLPHIKHLPEEYRTEFLDELVDNYLIRVPPETNGTIHLYDCYLEIEIVNR